MPYLHGNSTWMYTETECLHEKAEFHASPHQVWRKSLHRKR